MMKTDVLSSTRLISMKTRSTPQRTFQQEMQVKSNVMYSQVMKRMNYTLRLLRLYFLKKSLEFLGLLLCPWKLQRELSFTSEHFANIYYILCKFQDQKAIALEIQHDSFSTTPSNYTSCLVNNSLHTITCICVILTRVCKIVQMFNQFLFQ